MWRIRMTQFKSKNSATENKRLIRRYLIWCYKTTKEELDKVDRKFTQLKVDDFILKELSKQSLKFKNKNFLSHIGNFKKYIENKKDEALRQFFSDKKFKTINPDYLYLKSRLRAIEKSIIRFLGKKDLKRIQDLYENEMTQRILCAREHT